MGFFNSINKFLKLLIRKGLKTASKLPIIKNASSKHIYLQFRRK